MLSQVTLEELGKARLGPRPPVLIDVREPEEFLAAHMENAESIPLVRLAQEAARRFTNRSQPIVVYSTQGIRSNQAARLLRSLGYRSVKEIDQWNPESPGNANA